MDGMESKSAAVEIKTNKTPGEFTAVISAIGNVDRQGDRVMPGAFKSAIESDPIPPVYWAHKHDIPPIGEGLDWKEAGDTVEYTGRLFVKGDVEHQFASMVYAGMKSYDGRMPAIRQFSYTYGITESGAELVMENGKRIRNLLEVRPVAEVGPCFLGANPATGLVEAAKTAELKQMIDVAATVDVDFFQLGEKAEWDMAYMDSLPDSAFLYVEPGGSKDSSGKTTPRVKRHFPYKNAQGMMDMPHLRDAIDRAPQASTLDQAVRDRVQKRAQRLLRTQEGKAFLLSTVYSSKAWDDIEDYSIQQILEMLDNAVSYIQMEQDPGDVAQMQTIAQSLLGLLRTKFDEASSADTADSAAVAKAAVETTIDLYKKAMSSDTSPSVTPQEIVRLLSLGPHV